MFDGLGNSLALVFSSLANFLHMSAFPDVIVAISIFLNNFLTFSNSVKLSCSFFIYWCGVCLLDCLCCWNKSIIVRLLVHNVIFYIGTLLKHTPYMQTLMVCSNKCQNGLHVVCFNKPCIVVYTVTAAVAQFIWHWFIGLVTLVGDCPTPSYTISMFFEIFQ